MENQYNQHTQENKVLAILRENGCVDNFYCIDNRITIRLGAIIHKLKSKGLIELDKEKCGYIFSTKNWRYVAKVI